MIPTRSASRQSERGAVLIHVTISLLALLAFSAISIDYGIMWVGRTQAQTTADAAALAAATTMAYGDASDLAALQGRARAAARAVAAQNPVFGAAAVVEDTDITFPACPPGAPGAPDLCVRVDVFRNQARANPLPVFFAHLGGVENQGVRATATAQVYLGNASDCVAPWAVPDKWLENRAPVDEFNRYDKKGVLQNPADVYIPPFMSGATGYNIEDDYGTRVTLKSGNPQDAISPGWFLPVVIPHEGSANAGGDLYRENIGSCNGEPIEISTPGNDVLIPNEPGNMIGPTKQGVEDLIARDPNAQWDEATQRIVGSAYAISPRVRAIPIFDVDYYQAGRASGRTDIRIVNLLGFFVESMQGNDVTGILISVPHLTPGSSSVPSEFSFLRTVMLVR